MNGILVAYFPAQDRKGHIKNCFAAIWINARVKLSFYQDEPPLALQAPYVR
jgi:hypothetical protein